LAWENVLKPPPQSLEINRGKQAEQGNQNRINPAIVDDGRRDLRWQEVDYYGKEQHHDEDSDTRGKKDRRDRNENIEEKVGDDVVDNGGKTLVGDLDERQVVRSERSRKQCRQSDREKRRRYLAMLGEEAPSNNDDRKQHNNCVEQHGTPPEDLQFKSV